MRSLPDANSFARNVHSIRILAALAFFVLIPAFPATTAGQATIVLDSTGGAGDFDSLGTRTSLTWSHTIAAQTNRILIVGVSTTVNGLAGPPADRVLSVTYAGDPLTLIGSQRSPVPGGTRSSTEMYKLIAPPPGTANVVVTLVGNLAPSNYAVGGSVSFTGVHQTTPHGSFVSGSGSSDIPVLIVPSAANEVVVDNVATSPEAQFLLAGSGQSYWYSGEVFLGGLISVGAGSTEAGAPSVTMSWQSLASGEWATGAISLKPAATPTAAPAFISGQVTTSDGTPLGGVVMTLSGNAARRTITGSNGRYRFVDVETDGFYTLAPARANYDFNPREQSFALLGNKPDAMFTAEPAAESANPLDTAEFFARQQYLDFLGREPDDEGWVYWTDQINGCNGEMACIRQRRIDVSNAFFMSEEFGQSGSYIYRFYRAGLGRHLRFSEFAADRRNVIGGQNLDSSKAAFAAAFTQRAEFVEKYQAATTAETFTDALLHTIQHDAGIDLSARRDALIQKYNAYSDLNQSRSAVLRDIADNEAFKARVFNHSFVLMQYFGYLRRDPEPEGLAFWYDVLNNRAPGDYRGIACGFLTSAEYQRRFSSVVTRGNGECAR